MNPLLLSSTIQLLADVTLGDTGSFFVHVMNNLDVKAWSTANASICAVFIFLYFFLCHILLCFVP